MNVFTVLAIRFSVHHSHT